MAIVAWLGSHAACGGRGGRSSASTMREVVMARLARRARSGRCSWRFATIIILNPHPKILCIYMAAAPSAESV